MTFINSSMRDRGTAMIAVDAQTLCSRESLALDLEALDDGYHVDKIR